MEFRNKQCFNDLYRNTRLETRSSDVEDAFHNYFLFHNHTSSNHE